MAENKEKWDIVIRAHRGWWDLDLIGIWRYRDLVWLFVKRDFVSFYKQTILGPIWYILQPLFTTGVFTIIFGKVANITTNGTPPFLFYMAGTVCWSYFSQSLTKTSNTFIANAGVFGKVYFPRMTVPISTVIINFAQFFIQFLLFMVFYAWYLCIGSGLDFQVHLLALLPLILLQMALIGLGVGILISSLTSKYRDLVFALSFGIQLWMYASPVVYPASIIPEKYLNYYMLNPMAPIIEQFKLVFFGSSVVNLQHIIISWMITIGLLVIGLIMFHRVEKNFMDTV